MSANDTNRSAYSKKRARALKDSTQRLADRETGKLPPLFQQLMLNERNLRVQQHPMGYLFVLPAHGERKAARYLGMETLIQRKIGEGRYRPSLAYQRRRRSWTTCRRKGLAHGLAVHQQIAQVARGQRNLATAQTDGCVLKVFEWMAKHRWVILASEFKIWDECIRCVTAIDAICYDSCTKKLVLVEWKTGLLRQQWLNEDGPFRRHALQVALAQVILEERYAMPVGTLAACVFLINDRLNIAKRFITAQMLKEAREFYVAISRKI